MLSVLIPIYNHDVNFLVTALDHQLAQAGIPYEIILVDDCSDNSDIRENNANLAQSESIQYVQNQENMGRAIIRNLLAKKAQYPYLLFIDCDAMVVHQDYIKKYMDAIEKMRPQQTFVINGGIAYRNEKPDNQYFLRWYYGKRREEESAQQRNKRPYHHFTPFNVIISKSVFEEIQFDENLTTYGHEDTLFGYQLQQKQIPYLHIDNPLYHDGLDTNEEYLKKIRLSIDNLIYISESQNINHSFLKENRLLKTYHHCKKMGLAKLVRRHYERNAEKMQQRLCQKPSMSLIDLYKLSYLASKKL
jgi:glycosyltransferase involved in cell wall biosynthesis